MLVRAARPRQIPSHGILFPPRSELEIRGVGQLDAQRSQSSVANYDYYRSKRSGGSVRDRPTCSGWTLCCKPLEKVAKCVAAGDLGLAKTADSRRRKLPRFCTSPKRMSPAAVVDNGGFPRPREAGVPRRRTGHSQTGRARLRRFNKTQAICTIISHVTTMKQSNELHGLTRLSSRGLQGGLSEALDDLEGWAGRPCIGQAGQVSSTWEAAWGVYHKGDACNLSHRWAGFLLRCLRLDTRYASDSVV